MKKLAKVGKAVEKFFKVNFPFLFIAATAASASAANYYFGRMGCGKTEWIFAVFLGFLFCSLTICMLRNLKEEEEVNGEDYYYGSAAVIGLFGWILGLFFFSAFVYHEFRMVLNIGLSLFFTICVMAVIIVAVEEAIMFIVDQLEKLSSEERKMELWSMWRSALVLFTLFMLIPYL